ncbi:NAD(P)H-binding protein [Streptomonospora nanhaiensis]|uniref:NAD(P)H-binding protein n=1 Tax=Streptomonospora nanhaiensis TaxID=1323731 RepID=UPI001C9957CA|nr:NAD(P)H-binding protein [Streptomonospora nanhaiensis]MBX9389949.1 NAD(P)H-binding protein [Streptomonospora nanhaiensis]
MIVVTGETGNVGRPLVRALAAAGEQVTAVARGFEGHRLPPGVAALRADLTDPAASEALAPALEGAKALFLLTAASVLPLGGGAVEGVLAAARAAGVGRVVLLSSQGVGTGRHPSDIEDAVRAGGLDWTVLRPGGFHSNAGQWAPAVREQRTVAAPFGDVALPTVDPADIAAMAAAALTGDGHGGATYVLTGPKPVSPRAQAQAIGAALGERVRFVELSREQARERMLAFMPAPVVEATLAVLGEPTAEEVRVSPDVERVLGRAPRTFAAWAEDNAALFR